MEVKDKKLNIDLSVEVNNSEVIAEVLFSNNSLQLIYLDGWSIGLYKILTSSIFSIADKDNNRIPYKGMMGSRKIVPEDFIALNPGENIRTKITVNKDYELIKGHKYIIRFCAINPACPGKQPTLDLWSNKVEITY
jgi:hypothetical protein